MRLLRVHGGVVALTGAATLITGLLAACNSLSGQAADPRDVAPAGIHKIKHVIIVMQENRSFDHYFGTYLGAAGIPIRNGSSAVCLPKPGGGCTRPYHDTADINTGGPHGIANAAADIHRGKMDGFIQQQVAGLARCTPPARPRCQIGPQPDVMGYHTAAEIPNYWAYAKNFTLDDHMFEPVKSWSLPDHLYIVSGWSASCRTRSPMSCRNDIDVYRSGAFNSWWTRNWRLARPRSTCPGPTSLTCYIRTT